MLVYVLVPGPSHDGYLEPVGAFSTIELAEQYRDEYLKKHPEDRAIWGVSIITLTLDAPS